MANYQDRVKTLRDILEMSPNERKALYRVDNDNKHIDKVTIDGNVFTDYSAFSFLWEKSYVKSPVRSGDGTISNLDSYSTFLTPHLKIDFSLMSIDSYRVLMNLVYSKNEFTVTCYDVVNNRDTTNKMYFSTEEMPKLWTIVDALNGDENAVMLLGVQDYTVEMVGTNVSLDTVEVLYYDMYGVLINVATQSVDKGTEAIIDYNYVAPNGYRFDGEWKNETGAIVRNGDVVLLNQSIKLYAQVVPTNEYTLSFSYGNGNVLISQTAGEVNSVKITKGQTIGQAISNANITLNDGTKFTFPTNGTGSISVEYEEDKYTTPYEFKGWYWTPIASVSTRIDGNTTFNYDVNRIIYQIYEPKKYTVTYITNVSTISLDALQVAYGSNVSLPRLAMANYTFLGWYADSEFKNFFSGTMPPKDIILYARWERNT